MNSYYLLRKRGLLPPFQQFIWKEYLMKKSELFKDLSEESERLMKQFIDFNPIGSLILNDSFEILSINETLKSYFEFDINLDENYFGNIFKCQRLENSGESCGSKKQCANCKIRNSIINAFEFSRVIKNLQVNKCFYINGEKIVKWFEMTIVPIDMNETSFVWIALIDLTELMKYKIEFELNQVVGEENIIEKDKFHENVMNCIRTNCYTGGEAYLSLFELSHAQDFQDKLGSLWRDDYLSSFYHFLNDQMATTDFICKYSSNQFLVFLPCRDENDLKKILNSVNEYQYKRFHVINSVVSKTIKFKMDSPNVKQLVSGDQLHIQYFKAITLLEQLEDDTVFELLF